MEPLRLEKIGAVGAVIAAAACPICFPKLALIGAVFGLGAFSAYEYQFLIAAQIMVVLAVSGHAVSYRRHRNAWLLASALAGAAAVFAGLYIAGSELLVYAGFGALLAASSADLWERRRRQRRRRQRRPAPPPALESEITCPQCGFKRSETMPTDGCLFFYDCTGCGARLRPKTGGCCVFCSYGSVKCPPMQLA